MRLGVVSDTHGQVEFTRVATEMLDALEVDEIVHCGDIGGEQIIALFARWPSHFVFGNVDGDRAHLAEVIRQHGQTCHDRFGSLERAGRKIAFLHSDDSRRFASEVSSGQWDLVCYGHTHVAHQERQGNTLVLNPGAVYRANPHSIAVVELPDLTATHVNL